MSIAVVYPAKLELLGPYAGFGTDQYGTYPYLMSWPNRYVRSERHGYRNKDRYKFFLSNGYLPQHSYFVNSYKETMKFSIGADTAGGHYWPWQDSIKCDASSGYPGYLTPTALTAAKTAAANKLQSQLNTKVRGQYYSTFETLYEGQKTKKMVADAVYTTVKAARLVRRGRFTEAAKTLGLKKAPKGARKGRSLSGNWLEFRYGWGPLYYTVYGEMQRQYDQMKNKEPVQFVRVSMETVLPTVFGGDTVGVGATYNGRLLGSYFTVKDRYTATIRSNRTAFYRVTNPTLANATSMGLTNPLLVAWELVPFSFVADWFVNVSNVLEQMDVWVGKTYLSGTITHVTRGERFRYPVKTSGSGFVKSLGYYSGCYTYFERTIVSSPPTVMPSFELSMSPKRLVDGISLLFQIFKK